MATKIRLHDCNLVLNLLAQNSPLLRFATSDLSLVSHVNTASVSEIDDFVLPTEAVLGEITLSKGETPIHVGDGEGEQSYIALLNSKVVDVTYTDVANTNTNRSADACGWVKYRVGQIQAKRDANSNASADAWDWVRYKHG